MILLLLLPLYSQIVTPAARNPVGKLLFLDDQNGWIVGHDADTPVLLRTTDGGQTWTNVPLKTGFYDLYFLDRDLGWALGALPDELGNTYSTHLFRSTDGGLTWSRLSVVPGEKVSPLQSLLFIRANVGFFVLGSGAVLRTVDGGKTFAQIKVPVTASGRVRGLARGSNSRLWAFGENCLHYSDDLGENWKSALAQTTLADRRFSLWAAQLVGGKVLVLVGSSGGGVILRSPDDGATWQLAADTSQGRGTFSPNFFKDVHFWEPRRGCAVGASFFLYCTEDGGSSWSPDRDLGIKSREENKLALGEVMITQSGRGWVVMEGGFLYETLDFGRTWRDVSFPHHLQGYNASNAHPFEE